MKKYLKMFRCKSCDEFETDLVLYAYGKIAAEMRGGVEAHLDACGLCRDRQDQLLHELATAPLDFPQAPFWDDYSREMRQKLADVDEKRHRAWTWMAPLGVTGITAVAAGIVLIVALGMTLRTSLFSSGDLPREDAMIRVLPIVQNLEFFESMHYLEMMGREAGGEVKSSGTGPDATILLAQTQWPSDNPSVRPKATSHEPRRSVPRDDGVARPGGPCLAASRISSCSDLA